MKRKIMFIIHDINYGGAAKMLSFIANMLSEQGHEIYIYSYEGDSKNYPLLENIRYKGTEKKNRGRLIGFLTPIFLVRKEINKVKPDIVISFLTNTNLYSILGTIFTKIPVVIAERGDPYTEDSFVNRLKKYFYKYADGAVFQTEGAKEFYKKSIQDKSTVIPNPITIPYFEIIPFEQRENEIVFVARFDNKQKRQDIMVKAFQKVVSKNEEVQLVFYGDGKDKEDIERLVNDLKLSARIIFAGKVSDVVSVIRSAKIFVLTSDFEGIPNALIEAMVSGLAVVSTDCSPGGASLLIRNGVNGLLVPRGNSDKIAEAILFLLNNPIIAKEIANEATKIRSEYNKDKILTLWNQYIDKVASKL